MTDAEKSIFLTGIMGSGKSTIGQLLAQKTGRTFIDTDSVIECWAGKSISSIFKEEGEAHFRTLEHDMVKSLCSTRSAVIALGGGALEHHESRKLIREKGNLVWLNIQPDIAAARLENAGDRPLLGQADSVQDIAEELKAILESRAANYDTADFTIEADFKTPEALADDILAQYQNPSQENLWEISQQRISPYPIYIDYNAIGHIGKSCADRDYSDKVVIITDANVAELYLEQVADSLKKAGFNVIREILSLGEETKSLEMLEGLYLQMSEIGLDRKSPVIALGGGVIGDLAGFFAASFLRGIPLIHIPTSLLAQVDSSLGGKVGVNLPTGKNLVGDFYNPDFVLADINALYTLPPKEWNTGLGEVIKYGFIGKTGILDRIEQGKDALFKDFTEVVRECVAHKVDITTRDFTEGNIRRYLNFGHTLGHALEKVTEYKLLNHGEAVYWGTLAALYLSRESGHLNNIDFYFGIDIMDEMAFRIPQLDVSPEALHEALHFDKKRVRDTIHWVLLDGIGEPVIETDITREMIYGAIQFANDFVATSLEES